MTTYAVRAAAVLLLCAAAAFAQAQEPLSEDEIRPSPPQQWFAPGAGDWHSAAEAPALPFVAEHGGVAVLPHLGEKQESGVGDWMQASPLLFTPHGQRTGAGLLTSRRILVTGTACSTGACPCSTGACFLSSVKPGDKPMAGEQRVTVEQVVGDTALIVTPGLDPDVSAAAWSHVASTKTDGAIIWGLAPAER